MAKEAYYFSHDANAQHDFKCIKLRRELGWEGYGLFWGLIELLRCEPTYKLPLSSIEDLSYSMHTSKEKLAAIIHRYELFEIEEEYFFSSRLLRSMNDYNSLKNRLSEAGRKGGLSKAKAELKHPPSIKGKESKVNEIKEKESNIGATSRQTFTPPEKSLVIEYLTTEKNLDEFTAMGLADRWWNFYDSKNWMIGKNKMVRWKSAVNTWLNSPEFKKQTNRWQP